MPRYLDPNWRALQAARRKLAVTHSLEDVAAIEALADAVGLALGAARAA